MIERGFKNIEFEGFNFETGGNILWKKDEVVLLEPSAARVLRYFLENGGRLIAKEEILNAAWRDVFTTEDVLKRAVSQIRRALGDDAANPRFIETHHRRGYRFIAEIINGNGAENYQKATEKNLNADAATNARNHSSGDPNFDCFVGRGKEMEFLRAEFRRVLVGTGQPVLIAGEPGIGKTQTARKFVEWTNKAENKVVPLRVRFFDYEASFLPTYDVFLDLLSEACAAIFGLAADYEKEKLRDFIEAKLKIRLPDELFNSSAEFRPTVADASRTIAPLAESFVRLSRVRPLVLIFDDIQWADETSRKIIGYLMRSAGDAPLMFVGLTRRGDADDAHSELAKWLQKQAVYRSFTILELNALSLENCREIIAAVFGGRLDARKISHADLLKLHTATGGNPYFLIETLRLLLGENVIERASDKWIWRGIEDVPLPETIRMAARAKLSNLPDATRDLIECAAVLGDAFQIKTLEEMTASEGVRAFEKFENNLDEAVAAQVLTERNVSGADDCQFYHTTLRRAVYADLSPRRKKRLHSRAFRAIENSHSAEIERFAAALAAHAENAGDFSKSWQLNFQACRAAAARFDWLEAAELLNRVERVEAKIASGVKALTGEDAEFSALRGEVLMSVGRRSEAEKVLARAVSVAGDETASPLIFLTLGRTRILLGKYREAIAPLEKSLEIFQKTGDRTNAAAALVQLASAQYALCEYDASSAILEKIIADENAGGYNRAVALGKLGWTRALQSRYAEGKKLLVQALEFHRSAGDLRERAVLAMCLNWCEYGLGNYESAIEYALQARREAQIVGEPYNESVAQMRVAKSRIAQGFYAEAEEILQDVWEKQKDLDAPHAQAETIWMRGRARVCLGKYAEAAEDLQNALAMIRAVGDRDDEFRILIDRAVLENRLQNFAAALEFSERAAEIAAEIGISEGVGEALIAKTDAFAGRRKFAESIEAAREAVRLLEKFDSGELHRAHFALARILLAEKNLAQNSAAIEKHLCRAVKLLTKMREHFSDESRRRRFTELQNAPVNALRDFLNSQNRAAKAAKIEDDWFSN